MTDIAALLAELDGRCLTDAARTLAADARTLIALDPAGAPAIIGMYRACISAAPPPPPFAGFGEPGRVLGSKPRPARAHYILDSKGRVHEHKQKTVAPPPGAIYWCDFKSPEGWWLIPEQDG